MAGKRRNYQPIWERVRFLAAYGRINFPIRLWWRTSSLFAELVQVDEDNAPRLHIPAEVQSRFSKINWSELKERISNWQDVEKRVQAVVGNLDGTHSPNTLATAVYGPLENPLRTSQNYNFGEEFSMEGAVIKRLFADVFSKRDPVAAEVRFKSLTFRRSLIEPLKPDERFRIFTPFGAFVLTRERFESVFSNVATNEKNYIQNGSYSYTVPPSRTYEFLDIDETQIADSAHVSIRSVLDLLAERNLADYAEVDDDDNQDPDNDDGSSAAPDEVDARYEARNVILFGPPGTGKSFRLQTKFLTGIGIKPENEERSVFRVTFHPETSYFDFVGSYKPLLGMEPADKSAVGLDGKEMRLANGEPGRPVVYYGFEPGPFTSALVAAVREPAKNFALIIEEINRGNCAAIFGDVFQLLDRDEQHRSQYAIRPHFALASFLSHELRAPIQSLRLPSNLFIYATMNTSDQSLFPMDTAFKRRWALEYVGIAFDDPSVRKLLVPITEETTKPWWAVATVINQRIVAATGVDDKQMGPFFVRDELKGLVTAAAFRSKVLFYLWNDVFRGNTGAIFGSSIETYDGLVSQHRDRKAVFSKDVLDQIEQLITAESPQ